MGFLLCCKYNISVRLGLNFQSKLVGFHIDSDTFSGFVNDFLPYFDYRSSDPSVSAHGFFAEHGLEFKIGAIDVIRAVEECAFERIIQKGGVGV